jgi:hypothetical protein
MHAPGPAQEKRLLFWDEPNEGLLGVVTRIFGVVTEARTRGQPRDHVRDDVPRIEREELARALQLRSPQNPTGGNVLTSYLGWADCRICGARLGTRDFFGHGFVWPEKADHYVLVHKVWTGECTDLLMELRHTRHQHDPRR